MCNNGGQLLKRSFGRDFRRLLMEYDGVWIGGCFVWDCHLLLEQ